MGLLGNLGGLLGHFVKGAGPIGLVAGGAGYMMDRTKAQSAKHAAEFRASNHPYVIDSNGETVSDSSSVEDKFGEQIVLPAVSGTGEYYIVYPGDWSFDTSNDKVILDANGKFKGLKIAAYDSSDKGVKEKANFFNTKRHHGQSSTFVKVKADGSPDFSTAFTPKWNTEDTIAPGVKQAMGAVGTETSNAETNNTETNNTEANNTETSSTTGQSVIGNDLGLSTDFLNNVLQPINVKVGKQILHLAPRGQRDELRTLLNYRDQKDKNSILAQHYKNLDALSLAQLQSANKANEPSFIDKVEQGMGTFQDLLASWKLGKGVYDDLFNSNTSGIDFGDSSTYDIGGTSLFDSGIDYSSLGGTSDTDLLGDVTDYIFGG